MDQEKAGGLISSWVQELLILLMGAPLHFLFSLMISGGLSRPGGEMVRAGQTVGVNLSVSLHFASAEREHKKHISLLQRWK